MKQRKPYKASDYIYSYKEYPFIRHPHNPQWSFVKDKSCALASYNWSKNKTMDVEKCSVQCDECREICEFNDYIRGMSKPHFPMPVTMAVADTMLLHVTVCKGLLGECRNCIWPNCEC